MLHNTHACTVHTRVYLSTQISSLAFSVVFVIMYLDYGSNAKMVENKEARSTVKNEWNTPFNNIYICAMCVFSVETTTHTHTRARKILRTRSLFRLFHLDALSLLSSYATHFASLTWSTRLSIDCSLEMECLYIWYDMWKPPFNEMIQCSWFEALLQRAAIAFWVVDRYNAFPFAIILLSCNSPPSCIRPYA